MSFLKNWKFHFEELLAKWMLRSRAQPTVYRKYWNYNNLFLCTPTVSQAYEFVDGSHFTNYHFCELGICQSLTKYQKNEHVEIRR